MAKVIMIQGTMSNVGKSLITAGLCRIFREDGYRVAPFKSQNMALNSYVTRDGLEMGRAQAMQAEACGIQPTVFMNPVLLKPTTDMGSQVIVNGKPIGNMPATEYFSFKTKLVPEIKRAFNILSEQNDIIVVEGAGSPAEINLKQDDIVNMGLAKLIDAPVLLVGDIDRGGVFAQLYGTVALLEKEERDRIKGLIVNKFRGDRSILEPGIRMLEDVCQKKVLGVIPYGNFDIEEEDSLSGRFTRREVSKRLKICVIRLPKISNFTDFGPLEIQHDISLIYATKPQELQDADMILLPGTKNTIADMKWLLSQGLDESIRDFANHGGMVMGICGGYQMLGKKITDTEGVEGHGSIHGLGLLNVETDFGKEKHTEWSEGILNREGVFEGTPSKQAEKIRGYEIHMGNTSYKEGAVPLLWKNDGSADGCINGNVFGTYFHGILENEAFLKEILKRLYETKGIPAMRQNLDYGAYKEEQFGLLADTIRKNLDMEAVYDIL